MTYALKGRKMQYFGLVLLYQSEKTPSYCVIPMECNNNYCNMLFVALKLPVALADMIHPCGWQQFSSRLQIHSLAGIFIPLGRYGGMKHADQYERSECIEPHSIQPLKKRFNRVWGRIATSPSGFCLQIHSTHPARSA